MSSLQQQQQQQQQRWGRGAAQGPDRMPQAEWVGRSVGKSRAYRRQGKRRSWGSPLVTAPLYHHPTTHAHACTHPFPALRT